MFQSSFRLGETINYLYLTQQNIIKPYWVPEHIRSQDCRGLQCCCKKYGPQNLGHRYENIVGNMSIPELEGVEDSISTSPCLGCKSKSLTRASSSGALLLSLSFNMEANTDASSWPWLFKRKEDPRLLTKVAGGWGCRASILLLSNVNNKKGKKEFISAELNLKCLEFRVEWPTKRSLSFSPSYETLKLHPLFSLKENSSHNSLFPWKLYFFSSLEALQDRDYGCKVFENHRKSIIQHYERSELRLHLKWTKVS